MIKLTIFDLWQTLAYKDAGYSSISRILKETKLKIPRAKFIRIYEEALQTKKWSSKHEAYETLCRKIGLEATKENINLIMGIRDKAEAKTKLYPHTIPMLKQLRKQGYKTGLISNTTVFAARPIKKKTKLLKYIDYPLFSFDVGIIKPDLKFFKKMLKIAKCKPEETIMVGDTPKADVIPPRKLGMNAIHFKNYRHLKRNLAAFSIHLD